MKNISSLIYWLLFWFVALFILCLPFHYQLLPSIWQTLQPLLVPIVAYVGKILGMVTSTQNLHFFSDSIGLYLQTGVLFLLAIPLAIGSFWLDKKQNLYPKMRFVLERMMAYYLALQLLKYGCSKIFKHQFYLPEPNILYTPLGNLSKDILYWSTIGTSYTYTVFAGLIEILPALLLLFKRTRLLGAIIAFGVLLNVWMINIGFNITVKLYAAFLLGLSFLLIVPHLAKLYHFFIHQKLLETPPVNRFINSKRQLLIYTIAKFFIIGCLLIESLFLYFNTPNFNDDTAARPFLHGAYQVQVFSLNGDTISSSINNKKRWNKLFIHRKGYLIRQTMEGAMQDYELKYDLSKQQLLLRDYGGNKTTLDYSYASRDSLLLLNGNLFGEVLRIQAKQLNWEGLPVFREE